LRALLPILHFLHLSVKATKQSESNWYLVAGSEGDNPHDH
jgi:hypothetical protein